MGAARATNFGPRGCALAIFTLPASLSGTGRLLLLLSFVAQMPLKAHADEAPEQVFNNACRTCHTIREGDNRLGPNLYKIIGRKAGSLPDYNYSAAMKDAGFVWNEDNLARFIANPDEVVPGNNMKPYAGLASADDRRKAIAFLLSVGAR
jgi:cytochrome c